MRFWNAKLGMGVSLFTIFTFLGSSLPLYAALEETEETKTLEEVTVAAAKPEEEGPFLPDVQGTKIYAGKKTSVVDLDKLPTITNNNYRQALVKVPGLLLSEESTPLVSIGYRGLNPDRTQFMQVLKDGIPIVADLFGYPEAYYTPLLQTVDHIDFIRGGSGLLYGPQPGGALNYVTKKPDTEHSLLVHSDNAFGQDNYYSTYESVTGSLGPVGYLGYIHERQGEGFRRANSDFEVIGGGWKTTINQKGKTRLTLNYDEYHEEHGEPGGLSRSPGSVPTFDEDPHFSTRLYDRFLLERSQGSAIFEHEFSEKAQFDFRIYGGRYRRWSRRQRGGGFGTLPTGSAALTNDIQEQDFYTLGFEPRFRRDYDLWKGEHTFTFGTHTYFSKSPRMDQRGAKPWADSGVIRNENNRYSRYLAVFAENKFKWWRLSIIPAIRLEHLWQRFEEKSNVNRKDLVDQQTFDFVPLFGGGLVFDVGKGIELYANISQSWRPVLFAESVPTGSGQVVPQNIGEGRAVQYDFGLRGRPVPFFYWDVDYFLLNFKDKLGTVENQIRTVGDAIHQGMELGTEIDLVAAYDYWGKTNLVDKIGSVSPFVALTLLEAEFYTGPNKRRRPQFTPRYNLRFGVNYRWRERVKLSLLSTFVAEHWADDAGTVNRYIPSYKVWDLTAEVVLLKNLFGVGDLSLYGGVNNLFDEQYFARVTGTGVDPGYPRNIYGGFKVSLGAPRLGKLFGKAEPETPAASQLGTAY
jgi:Fe(3+) dicitrate transport protein